jgi:hypothetical protein
MKLVLPKCVIGKQIRVVGSTVKVKKRQIKTLSNNEKVYYYPNTYSTVVGIVSQIIANKDFRTDWGIQTVGDYLFTTLPEYDIEIGDRIEVDNGVWAEVKEIITRKTGDTISHKEYLLTKVVI